MHHHHNYEHAHRIACQDEQTHFPLGANAMRELLNLLADNFVGHPRLM